MMEEQQYSNMGKTGTGRNRENG
jgi:hypothetical protein